MHFHIVKTIITSPDTPHGPWAVGLPEWQFSDGPSGDRSVSFDYAGPLENAVKAVLKDHPGSTFEFEEI
jgi:hypothetical protein